MTKRKHPREIDLDSIEPIDSKIYDEFKAGNCVGVFQFETPGLIRLSQVIGVSNFDELMAATALHRPGPLMGGQTAQYPISKHSGKWRKAEHPIIDKIVQETYGEVLYQEQIMRIVRELGGFNWKDTNDIRKCMSKSGGAEYFYRNYWDKFKDGCKEKGIEEKKADAIFRRCMTFGAWCFNQAHAASYGMLSYQCMWLKYNYPIEFITAQLIHIEKDTKILKLINEAKRLGIKIEEPEINRSGSTYRISKESIVCGLADIKNVGIKAIDEIVSKQPFNSLIDFLKKVERRKVNSRVIKSLIQSGCLREFHPNMKSLMTNIDKILNDTRKKNAFEDKNIGKLQGLIRRINKSKDKYTDMEEAKIKSAISPTTVGVHLVTYFKPLIKKFAPHIMERLVKTSDLELTHYAFFNDKDAPTSEVYCVGQIKSMDLKRFSQEVHYIVSSEEEFRYCLCDFEDETDYCLLTFKAQAYIEYEKRLWEWGKNAVLLADGTVLSGMRKIYADRVWNLELVWDKLKRGDKLKWEEKYLFKHPMEFQLKEPNKVRKELGCISIEEMMGKDKWKFNYVVGYIMYMSYRNSKEWGKYYDISFEDETMRSRFLLHPKHFPNFKKVEDILHKHMVHHHPIVLNLSSNSDALINRERYMRKGPTCWLQKPEIGQKYTAIKSPFKIHGRGINEL